jgi:hypothetical protein
MASRRLGITAVTNDALASEDIRLVEVLSRVNFWASSVTNGDLCGLRLNKTIIMDDGEVNTISGDVIDSSMDQLVFNTVVGAGQLKVPVPTLTTELQFLISVEPVL